MNAQTMISVEKNRRALDLVRRLDDPLDERPRPVRVVRRDVPVDVLDDDHGAVYDDPEVDRADGEQVGRLPLEEEDRHGEQQRQRDHQGHDQGAGKVSQEYEQDQDDQEHADDEVVHDVVRRHLHEVGPLVEWNDLHPFGQEGADVDLVDFLLDRLRGRQRLLVLAHQHDALDDVVVTVAADDPEPRLIADDDLGDLLDVDRHIVVGGYLDILDILELLDLDRVGVLRDGRFERVSPLAQVTLGPDVMRLLTQREDVAAHIGVGLRDGVGDHLQGDVVPPHELHIQQDLVLLDGPAESGHIDHARHGLEGPIQDPVLDRLQVVQGIAVPFQDIADDLADRTPRGQPRGDPGRKVADHAQAIDHLLPGRPVIRPVLELALDIVEPRQRNTPQVFQARHAVEGRLDWDPDQEFHLLGAAPGLLRDDFDQRRGRVRVCLNIEVAVRVDPQEDQPNRPQQDDKAIVETPRDERAYHRWSLGPDLNRRGGRTRTELALGSRRDIVVNNGAEGARTLNLRIANAALSQLSYRPNRITRPT